MSNELTKTIERLELWVEYWGPHHVPEFIADLRVLIGAAKAVSRAVEVLHGLEDVTVTMVDHAVAILQEERQQ